MRFGSEDIEALPGRLQARTDPSQRRESGLIRQRTQDIDDPTEIVGRRGCKCLRDGVAQCGQQAMQVRTRIRVDGVDQGRFRSGRDIVMARGRVMTRSSRTRVKTWLAGVAANEPIEFLIAPPSCGHDAATDIPMNCQTALR